MATFKVTMFFSEQGNGWSETFYQESAAIDTPQFVNNIGNLWQARLGIMSRRIAPIGVRVSDPTVFRDSRFYSVGNDPLGNLGPNYNLDATEVQVAVAIRLEATARFRRIFLLRGCPERIVDPLNNTYAPVGANAPPLWNVNMFNFLAALKGANFNGLNAGQWLLWVDDADTTPPQLARNIIVAADARSFTFTTSSQLQITPAAGPAIDIVPAAPIVITGARGTHGLRGKWRLKTVVPIPPAAGPYTYTVFPEKHLISVPDINQVCFVRALNYLGKPIDSAFDEKLAIRKTGRPFGLPRGRRPAGL